MCSSKLSIRKLYGKPKLLRTSLWPVGVDLSSYVEYHELVVHLMKMKTLVAGLVLSVFIVSVLCNEGSECVTVDGRPGICRSNCPESSQAKLDDTNNPCGFKNEEAKVCCPRKSYPILDEACSYRTQKLKARQEYFNLIEAMAKKEYQWHKSFLDYAAATNKRLVDGVVRSCEVEAQRTGGIEGEIYSDWCKTFKGSFTRIVYGTSFEVAQDKYPHMVLLGWRNSSSISWNCVATLVHKSFVVTTAHCIFKYGKPPDLARVSEQTMIRRGNDKFAVDYDVDKVIPHESFDSSKLYNDIALLKIKLRSDLGDKAPPLPICIWTQDDYPTTDFRTLGYGSPSLKLPSLLSLRDNYVSLESNGACSKMYKSNNMLPDGLRESQLCGSDPRRVLRGCKDETGGPLLFIDADELDTPYLVGIASFGLQCRGGKPGIYTRIYDFLDWIDTKMNENML